MTPATPPLAQDTCPDCGVHPSQLHLPGCDVERCPRCGGQMLSCECVYEINGLEVSRLEKEHPAIFEYGPTTDMYAKWDAQWGDRLMPWTGKWPGVEECREYGFYCKMVEGKGWVPCEKDDPEATEDLNRLVIEGEWDQRRQRFVLPVK